MSLKQRIELTTNVVLVFCVVTVTAMIARRELFPPSAEAGLVPSREKDWRKYAVGDKRIGPLTAPVTVTEFSDFQCPACLRLYRGLKTIRASRGDDVAIVYRNYPLVDLHPFARPAAIAAECAAEQGRFDHYHSFLFEHQDSLASVNWTAIAARVGVTDTTGFKSCLTGTKAATRLRVDSLAAAQLRIPGTPLVLVNGWVFRGAPSVGSLDSLISRELKNHRANASR